MIKTISLILTLLASIGSTTALFIYDPVSLVSKNEIMVFFSHMIILVIVCPLSIYVLIGASGQASRLESQQQLFMSKILLGSGLIIAVLCLSLAIYSGVKTVLINI